MRNECTRVGLDMPGPARNTPAMIMRLSLRLAASALALSTFPAMAQMTEAPTGTSMPQPAPLADTIPPPRDVPYPGTIRLAVDATDVAHGIFRTTETIPVQPGPVVLLYPNGCPAIIRPPARSTRLQA